jgi:hypothetical protein
MATATIDANQFEVEGYGVRITYSKSSFAGGPRFSYRDKERSLDFSGSEIRVEATGALGDLVTVTIEEVPDLRTVTVTLLVPKVNIPDTKESPFETEAVFTTNHTTIGGPSLVQGQLKSYKSVRLAGTAQQVDF